MRETKRITSLGLKGMTEDFNSYVTKGKNLRQKVGLVDHGMRFTGIAVKQILYMRI